MREGGRPEEQAGGTQKGVTGAGQAEPGEALSGLVRGREGTPTVVMPTTADSGLSTGWCALRGGRNRSRGIWEREL